MDGSGPIRGVAAGIVGVARGTTPTHRHLRERLVAVAATTVLVDVIASVVILFVERHAPRSQIHSFGSAVFWTSGQLLTVSSQLPNPISAAGRVVDLVLELYAITVVATLAGSLGAFFHRRGLERDPLPGQR